MLKWKDGEMEGPGVIKMRTFARDALDQFLLEGQMNYDLQNQVRKCE